MMKLSVNINTVALLRNSRGGDVPSVVNAAINAERFGAQGITVHPRPDERHITYADVYDLKKVITTQLNIRGVPSDSFTQLVLDVTPQQVTLIPEIPNAPTPDNAHTKQYFESLGEKVARFQERGIRVSILLSPVVELVQYAKETGADRIELHTKEYAIKYAQGEQAEAIAPYLAAVAQAQRLGIELNAGGYLDRSNLRYLAKSLPVLREISVGHALMSDALYLGLENAIQLYLRELK